MASLSADDPELLRALSAFAALGIGGIAIQLIEMELGEVHWVLSVSEGRKWHGPARGRGEYGNGLVLRKVEEGVIIVQTCNEGLCCGVCEPGFVSLSSKVLFGDCDFVDMLCRVALISLAITLDKYFAYFRFFIALFQCNFVVI
jgi:hypothetical protein